ncbi:MFS transporter [Agromyces archimandritae]|uniref:MFS transporter n=1 Tax=Agromyces archimandritae TaxID=2781962 RepID=A0A975FM28_9MICO|nr:MFS transporter [Agromyces archimandritae]QTX04615.1 MFS transporter [Agromyces archimandritae]
MPDQNAPLIRHTGVAYFPTAFLARFPFAMMVVGVLTLVVEARGSVGLGGLTSAMVGIGTACLGPLIGAAADRFGQRPVVLAAGLVNGLLLGAFAWIVYSPAPEAGVLAAAFLVGATAPQVAPMSRARLVGIIGTRVGPARRGRTFERTMSYESAADETVFVFGPFLVGILAASLGPWAPIVGAGILEVVFVTAFALHPSGRLAVGGDGTRPTSPARELAHPAILVVVTGILGVGFFFGTMLTSLTAFMADRGVGEQAGLVYGVMGIGSAAFALGVALLPARFTKRWRWIAFGALMLAGTLVLPAVGDIAGITAALAVIGIGIGPVLVTQYALGAERSPAGRSATVMTMLGSAVIVGQSLAAAATGWVAEQFGTGAALTMPIIAAAIVVAAGVANAAITGTSRPAPAEAGR